MIAILSLMLGWVITGAIYSFTVIVVLVILLFCLPFTVELNRKGIMSTYKPAYMYCGSVALLSGIFALYSYLVFHFGNIYLQAGYFVAIVVTSVLSLGKLGRNKDNLGEYLENNKEYIDQEKLGGWLAK